METPISGETAIRAAFDGSTATARLFTELVVTLVGRRVLDHDEVGELLTRTAGVIQCSPAHGLDRVVWQSVADELRRRLPGLGPVAELPVLPLPPDPEDEEPGCRP